MFDTKNIQYNQFEHIKHPYSMPKIFNHIKAVKPYGTIFGLITLLPVLYYLNFYLENIFAVDFILLLNIYVLNKIKNSVCDGKIKRVCSESRKFNSKLVDWLLVMSYSGVFRLIASIIGIIFVTALNEGRISFEIAITPILSLFDIVGINLTNVIVGVVVAIILDLLFLFPKDISVEEWHRALLKRWNDLTDPDIEDMAPSYIETIRRAQKYTKAYNKMKEKEAAKAAAEEKEKKKETPIKNTYKTTQDKGSETKKTNKNTPEKPEKYDPFAGKQIKR